MPDFWSINSINQKKPSKMLAVQSANLSGGDWISLDWGAGDTCTITCGNAYEGTGNFVQGRIEGAGQRGGWFYQLSSCCPCNEWHLNMRQGTIMKFQYGMGMSIVDTFPHFLPVAGGYWATLWVPLHYPVVCPRTCASNRVPFTSWIVNLEVLSWILLSSFRLPFDRISVKKPCNQWEGCLFLSHTHKCHVFL